MNNNKYKHQQNEEPTQQMGGETLIVTQLIDKLRQIPTAAVTPDAAAQSASSVTVSAEIDRILRSNIYGNDYKILRAEDLGRKPFSGFLLHVDEKYAYIEVGASPVRSPTIVVVDRNRLESVPSKVDRQTIRLTFEGAQPTVTLIKRLLLVA